MSIDKYMETLQDMNNEELVDELASLAADAEEDSEIAERVEAVKEEILLRMVA